MLALSLVVCSTGIAEPVGTAFTYQGRLNDTGDPGNGDYDFRVELYDAEAEGTLVGGPSYLQNQTVTDGYFTLVLDFGDVFDGQARWLEIGVMQDDEVYEILLPRQKVMPTPYALRALNGSYTGVDPINVDNEINTIGLNAATSAGDLMTWDGNNWVAQQPAIQRFTIPNMQPWLGVNYCIALFGLYPSRNLEPFVGEIMMVGFNYPPIGWALCDGQLLSISQNDALFSLLGTIYGGDGRTTYGLPDLRGRVPLHPGTGPGLTNRTLGQKGGSETTGR